MMKPGKSQSKANDGADAKSQARVKARAQARAQARANASQFQPGVVIAAEIVFAAILLYLTNHPVNLSDFTHAGNGPVEELDQAAGRTAGIPALFEDPATSVAVASTTISPVRHRVVE